MKVILLTVGGEKESWLKELLAGYQKKLGHFVNFSLLQLRKRSLDRGSALAKKNAEARQLLNYLEDQDYVILFDEKGRQMDSMDFASRLERALQCGRQRVIFTVAGAYGANEELRARAQETWSLSRLTFNHLIAQAVAAEQIYRGLTIWKGIQYHNE